MMLHSWSIPGVVTEAKQLSYACYGPEMKFRLFCIPTSVHSGSWIWQPQLKLSSAKGTPDPVTTPVILHAASMEKIIAENSRQCARLFVETWEVFGFFWRKYLQTEYCFDIVIRAKIQILSSLFSWLFLLFWNERWNKKIKLTCMELLKTRFL